VTRLVLIRHGEAVDVAGRCIGQTDTALSDKGAAAMRNLGAVIQPFILPPLTMISSDLKRCTASAQSMAVGVTFATDPRLREAAFGEWDGRTWDDLEQNDGERLRVWMDDWTRVAPPSGESIPDLLGRVRAVLEEWHTTDGTIIAITHAGWIRAAVTALTGVAVAEFFNIPADNAKATIIDVGRGPATIVSSNIGADP
jgi:alpha-ribazole phosphatase